VAESVRRGSLVPDVGLEYLVHALAPVVDDAVEPLAAANHERLVAEFLVRAIRRSRSQSSTQAKTSLPVLFCPQKNLVALQPLHIEDDDIGNSQARVCHEPDQVLEIFASQNAGAVSVTPLLIVEVVTGFDDVREL
jgi:hypothetical protein